MEASRLIQNKQTPASMGVGGWVLAEGCERLGCRHRPVAETL